MLIKVCGLTRAGQLEALAPWVDFTGMIFYPPSPRYVGEGPPEGYAPQRIAAKKTGVFVNTPAEAIRQTARRFSLNAIQLHGNEPPGQCASLKPDFVVLKVVRVKADTDFESLQAYAGCVDYFLFDTAGKQAGGTGKKFSWKQLEDYAGATPFLLAGGIGPGDVQAVRNFQHPQFAGVDLNSRFETHPGVKDIPEVEKFVRALRNM